MLGDREAGVFELGDGLGRAARLHERQREDHAVLVGERPAVLRAPGVQRRRERLGAPGVHEHLGPHEGADLGPFGRDAGPVGLGVDRGERLVDAARRAERADQDAPGLVLTPRVAQRMELGDGGPRVLDRAGRAPAPQVDAAEQHVEDARDPPVAGGLALGQLLAGEHLGVLEPALHEADPREHRERPVEAAPVVEVAEHVGRGREAAVGDVGVAPEERGRGEVLHRPCLAPAVADLAEQLQGLRHVGLGRIEIALEHHGAAAGAQGVRLAGGVAQLAPHVDGPFEGRDRRDVVPLHLLEVAEDGERPGRDALVGRRVLEHVLDVGAGGRQLALLGEGTRPAELEAPSASCPAWWATGRPARRRRGGPRCARPPRCARVRPRPRAPTAPVARRRRTRP